MLTCYTHRNTHRYTQPSGGEIWVLILEKAVAKFCGSYATLTYGQPSWALQLLLGPPKMAFYERHPAGPAGMWQQGYLSR